MMTLTSENYFLSLLPANLIITILKPFVKLMYNSIAFETPFNSLPSAMCEERSDKEIFLGHFKSEIVDLSSVG